MGVTRFQYTAVVNKAEGAGSDIADLLAVSIDKVTFNGST